VADAGEDVQHLDWKEWSPQLAGLANLMRGMRCPREGRKGGGSRFLLAGCSIGCIVTSAGHGEVGLGVPGGGGGPYLLACRGIGCVVWSAAVDGGTGGLHGL